MFDRFGILRIKIITYKMKNMVSVGKFISILCICKKTEQPIKKTLIYKNKISIFHSRDDSFFLKD